MKLKEFISQALQDIMGGVLEAQEKISDGIIIPSVSDSFKSVETGISDIQPIDFEVSVTADEKAGSEAKLSVVAAFIGGNIKGQTNQSAGHVAKLRFKIPVKFPKHKKL